MPEFVQLCSELKIQQLNIVGAVPQCLVAGDANESMTCRSFEQKDRMRCSLFSATG